MARIRPKAASSYSSGGDWDGSLQAETSGTGNDAQNAAGADGFKRHDRAGALWRTGTGRARACARIEAAATTALAIRAQLQPPRIDGAVDLEVDMLRPVMTELACLIPGVELRTPLTLGFHARDFPAAYNMIDVFSVLAASQ